MANPQNGLENRTILTATVGPNYVMCVTTCGQLMAAGDSSYGELGFVPSRLASGDSNRTNSENSISEDGNDTAGNPSSKFVRMALNHLPTELLVPQALPRPLLNWPGPMGTCNPTRSFSVADLGKPADGAVVSLTDVPVQLIPGPRRVLAIGAHGTLYWIGDKDLENRHGTEEPRVGSPHAPLCVSLWLATLISAAGPFSERLSRVALEADSRL